VKNILKMLVVVNIFLSTMAFPVLSFTILQEDQANLQPNQKVKQSNHMPGEVIIKFKDDAYSADQLPTWPLDKVSTKSYNFRKVQIALNEKTLPKTAGAIESQTGAGVSMRILWKVTQYIIGEKATWCEKEARQMLFKPLDIDVNSITFDGKTCRDVFFKEEKVKTKEYLDNYFHTTPQALDIMDETADVIKTNCNLPGFGEYLRLKDRRLVIQINGVFFFMEPEVNY
jgi:hypothetical protein